MLTGKPILTGESDGHQLEIIWDLMGSPTPENMPMWHTLPGAEALQPRPRPGNLSTRFRDHGSGAISLLKDLLRLDWRTRINAIDALQHPYFKMAPLPAQPGELPTFEESHELDRRKFQDRKAALPPAPKGGTVGMGPEAHGANAGFRSTDLYGGRSGMNGSGYRNGDERRPAWQRDRILPGERGLPPRPPPPADHFNGARDGSDERGSYRDRDRDRDRDRHRGGRDRLVRGGDVDTYIPSYGRDDGRHRDERVPYDRRRRNSREDWRPDRDRRTRSRSRSPIRDRERDRDRDRDRDLYRR